MANYSPTVALNGLTFGSYAPLTGGPRQVCGYFTANAAASTSTNAVIDLSDYCINGVEFLQVYVEDTAGTKAKPSAAIKALTYSITSTSITIGHSLPSTATATIRFIANVY